MTKRRRGFPVGAVVATAIAAVAVTQSSAAGATFNERLALVQVPAGLQQLVGGDVSNSIFAGRYVVGMRVVVADPTDVAASLRVVSEGFVCATDPVFNHDGTRLAFSGKRSVQEHLQIWELAGQETLPRRIVTCDADCIQPIYMPSGHIVFASFLAAEFEEHGGRYATSLYELAPGSDAPTRITHNPSSEFDPTVLLDGRILFSSWQHVGNHHWPLGIVALMLINSDGTGVFPLTGNHRGPWLKRGALPLAHGRVAFVQSAGFDDGLGAALVSTSLNDAFASYQALIPPREYEVRDVGYGPGGGLIVSARPTDKSSDTFGLFSLKDGVVEPLFDDPRFHELSPAGVTPLGRPDRRISTVEPDTPFGYLAILDCYDTDRTDQRPIRPGSIKSIRVIEGRPLRYQGKLAPTFLTVPGRRDEPMVRANSATGYIPARILGEVPPAADGSVYLKVPADRPLRLQLIDHDGLAIINERAWFWVRPKERRICIGCHENREHAPSNATPLAVQQKPVDLTDPAGWETVSFREDIQPILTKNCAVAYCHVPPTPTAGLNQTADELNGNLDAVLADRFGPAYANLLDRQENKPFAVGGRRVHPGDARRSPLMWMIHGRPLADQYKPAPFDRPILEGHPENPPTKAQLDLIAKWIDLGAPYADDSPPGPWPYKIPPAQTTEAGGESR